MAIYGDNEILKDCVDAYKAVMDALKTAMDSAATDPRPSAIYSGHNQVKMSLPAISVDLALDEGAAFFGDIQGDKRNAGAGTISVHSRVALTIRVHTSYHRGGRNNKKIRELVNSVLNYIEVNRETIRSTIQGTDNVSYLFITLGDVDLLSVFDESLTIGATIPILIDVEISHVQL